MYIYISSLPWGLQVPSHAPNTVRVERLIYVHIRIYVYICVNVLHVYVYCLEASVCHYGVATNTTLLQIIGLFCKRAFAKEPFKRDHIF